MLYCLDIKKVFKKYKKMDKTNKILIALPKGRILGELEPLLKDIGIILEDEFFNKDSRKLIFNTNFNDIDVVRVRSFDVATFVRFGGADVGICGLDVLKEFPSSDIYQALDLGIGKCRLSIAAKSSKDFDLSKISSIKVATKYPNIAKEYFSNNSIQSHIVKLNGAIEIAPDLLICDAIIDLVSSGKTLEENSMVEVKKLFDVTSHLIVNRTSFKVKNKKIIQLISAFNEKL